MAYDPVTLYGAASRARPGNSPEAGQTAIRATRRGDLSTVVIGKPMISAAFEGAYFHASNPTPGTGIAGIAAADGYNAEETLLTLYNSSTESEGVYVCPDFIEITNTVVDTAGTTIRYDVHIDNIQRWVSGGSTLTANNCNMDSSTAAVGVCRFGALVTSVASTTVRKLAGRSLSSTDIVVDDVIRLEFGAMGSGTPYQVSHLPAEATLARMWVLPQAPVVLGPGDTLLFTVNCASQSGAATWEVQVGWYER